MSGRVALALVAVLVLAPMAAVVGPASAVVGSGAGLDSPGVETDRAAVASTAANASEPRIAAVYPNPVAHRDRGEFVLLDVPPGTRLSRFDLGDRDDAYRLPNVTASGTVALSPDPAAVRNLTEHRVVELSRDLALANGGDRVSLERDGSAVSTARYQDAPDGEIGRYDAERRVTWRPLGATNRSIVRGDGETARAFLLPDAPEVPIEEIRRADGRVLLAGYTFSSRRVADALANASERGVTVRVLLEGEPIGGISRRQARLLDDLADRGVRVELLSGPRDRYAYHHPKYAVVDDRAVVTTENWKPAGTGGRSSRGWGVVVSDPAVVEGLVETFRADAGWSDTRSWRQFSRGRSFEEPEIANGSYPSRHDPERVRVDRTDLLVAPDNAGEATVHALESAEESVDVVQVSISGPDQRFLRSAIEAARRGVDVRILLGGAWYVREDNRDLVEHLEGLADRKDLPIEAKLAEPDGRFEKIHAKGAIVDEEEVLLGSLNWNDAASRENREVVLRLEGEEIGSYYAEAFEDDWSGSVRELPIGFLAAVAGVVLLAGLVAVRVEFDGDLGVGPGGIG